MPELQQPESAAGHRGTMRALIDVIWPTLEGWTASERADQHYSNREDVEGIKQCDWSRETEFALREAKDLASSEEERRRAADGKASTYLLVAAALVTLLTYLESAIWDQKAGTKWASMPVLVVAVVYLMQAGVWAFRTLQVRAFVRVDVDDLLRVWSGAGDAVPKLVAEHLAAVRRNRDPVNDKVSAILMAHKFLLRAFLMFGTLLVVEAGWGLWATVQAPCYP